jgi:hypothetical protein
MSVMTDEQKQLWETNLRHFDIRRKMVVHEDVQINARLTMLIQTQGWLVMPSVLLVSAKELSQIFALTLLFVFAVSGCLAAHVFSRSIAAAVAEQDKILGNTTSAITTSFPFLDAEHLSRALQAEGVQKTDGRTIIKWVPTCIYILWAAIFFGELARTIVLVCRCLG